MMATMTEVQVALGLVTALTRAHPEAVDIHCRWRDRGVSTQDIYDARSTKRRVRVSEAMRA
jgi:hypothetical protein